MIELKELKRDLEELLDEEDIILCYVLDDEEEVAITTTDFYIDIEGFDKTRFTATVKSLDNGDISKLKFKYLSDFCSVFKSNILSLWKEGDILKDTRGNRFKLLNDIKNKNNSLINAGIFRSEKNSDDIEL